MEFEDGILDMRGLGVGGGWLGVAFEAEDEPDWLPLAPALLSGAEGAVKVAPLTAVGCFKAVGIRIPDGLEEDISNLNTTIKINV